VPPPNPQLPNRECAQCQAPHNRFLQHVETKVRPARYESGMPPQTETIAVFICRQNPKHQPMPEIIDQYRR
jgi:hypothetical protein